MIILRNKLFAKIEYRVSKEWSLLVVKQIIKITEMVLNGGDHSKRDLRHWIIEKLQNDYLKHTEAIFMENMNSRRIKLRYQDLFVLMEDKNEILLNKFCDPFGTELRDFVSNSRIGCGEEFIKKAMLVAEGPGGDQYGNYFRNLEKQPERVQFYLDLVRYISLYISGQLSPEYDSFFSNPNLKVDYTKLNPKCSNIVQVRSMIVKCIERALLDYNGRDFHDLLEEFI